MKKLPIEIELLLETINTRKGLSSYHNVIISMLIKFTAEAYDTSKNKYRLLSLRTKEISCKTILKKQTLIFG